MQPVVDLKDCVIVHVTPDIHVSHTWQCINSCIDMMDSVVTCSLF